MALWHRRLSCYRITLQIIAGVTLREMCKYCQSQRNYLGTIWMDSRIVKEMGISAHVTSWHSMWQVCVRMLSVYDKYSPYKLFSSVIWMEVNYIEICVALSCITMMFTTPPPPPPNLISLWNNKKKSDQMKSKGIAIEYCMRKMQTGGSVSWFKRSIGISIFRWVSARKT